MQSVIKVLTSEFQKAIVCVNLQVMTPTIIVKSYSRVLNKCISSYVCRENTSISCPCVTNVNVSESASQLAPQFPVLMSQAPPSALQSAPWQLPSFLFSWFFGASNTIFRFFVASVPSPSSSQLAPLTPSPLLSAHQSLGSERSALQLPETKHMTDCLFNACRSVNGKWSCFP